MIHASPEAPPIPNDEVLAAAPVPNCMGTDLAEALYAQWPGLICHALYVGARGHHDAEDIVQEALFRLWRVNPPLNPDSPDHYLRTVVRNRTIDAYRRRKTRPDTMPMFEDDNAPEVTVHETPETTVLGELAVQEALSCLSDKHRAVVQLLYEGNSNQEIAEMLDIPVGTVKSRACNARRILKDAIAAGQIAL